MSQDDLARIAGNIGALNSLNSLQNTNTRLGVHQTRLATGKRINSAEEDPAGLSMAMSLDVNRGALNAVLNVLGDSQNLLSVAEGGLKSIMGVLTTMREKMHRVAGDTVGKEERKAVEEEVKQLGKEIGDLVEQTDWNGTKLLEGGELSFLTGEEGQMTSFKMDKMTDLESVMNGDLSKLDSAIGEVMNRLQSVGSYRERFRIKEDSVMSDLINTEAAYNRIMNANMAEEAVQSSIYSILQQTSTSMLAQANVAPQAVLSLFQ